MKTFGQLQDGDCKFIPGDEDRDHMFCGDPRLIYLRDGKLARSPYCSVHHFECVMEPKARRVAA